METYKIDFAKGTITITKAFAEKANDINSDEYKTLKTLRKDHPQMSVVQRTHASPKKYINSNGTKTVCNQYKNLTYERMELFMNSLSNAEDYLKEYRFLKDSAAALQYTPYPIVRKWFTAQFPKYHSNPVVYLVEQPPVISSCEIIKANMNTLAISA